MDGVGRKRIICIGETEEELLKMWEVVKAVAGSQGFLYLILEKHNPPLPLINQ